MELGGRREEGGVETSSILSCKVLPMSRTILIKQGEAKDRE